MSKLNSSRPSARFMVLALIILSLSALLHLLRLQASLKRRLPTGSIQGNGDGRNRRGCCPNAKVTSPTRADRARPFDATFTNVVGYV
jgi:hypothetical protein